MTDNKNINQKAFDHITRKERKRGMIDISEERKLKEYLINKNVVKDVDQVKIHYCQGGVSCTVAYVETKEQPMIIKQALRQLKTKDTWLCDPNRMYIEYASNQIYHDLLPDCAPKTYFYDEDNYIYGREAVPDGCLMWKDYLMQGDLNFEIAKKSVDVLVAIHNKCAGDAAIKKAFENKEVFYGLRISPYFEFTTKKHTEISKLCEELTHLMMDSAISLVHGDYSPKNIMIMGEKIQVLDFEVAHYGHPAFDLAFLVNHIILKSVKFEEYAAGYLALAEYMMKRYLSQMTFMNQKEFEPVFVKTLQMLFLARIDGKSPVEYLCSEPLKQEKVRKISLSMIKDQIERLDDMLPRLKHDLI